MEKYKIVVKGLVKNEGKYAIVQRWYDDRILDPYRWGFVDGQIEFGEAPDKAVVRLIREQLGIDSVMDRVLYTWTYMVGDTFHVGICYECFALQTETILSEDLQQMMWVEPSQFEEYIDNQDILHDLRMVMEF
ncbi:NUDIX domain-containing protein [Lachnoclostridium phytofermentans]|jgi:nucleoside triphosphatase|uniref:NUDIX domain-containing protein n=1 Tax=Lachnoclostridium phytofermentans TaxID=66219 RepID=UPI00068D887B|nr:NUDIX domain-containing protein [Lachnoclostridium phytofermentans]